MSLRKQFNSDMASQIKHYQQIKSLIKNGHEKDVAHYVLTHDVDLTLKSNIDMPDPYLHMAARADAPKLVDFFMSLGCHPDMLNIFSDNLVDMLCQDQNLDMLQHVAQYPECVMQINANALETPLHKAVMDRDMQTSMALCDLGADINARGIGGQTPIFIAVRQNNKPFVEMLHKSGADIAKIEDVRGNNLLHVATMHGAADAVSYLLAHNVDPNHMNERGISPLYYAVESQQQEIFTLLIENGADIDARNCYGHSLLHQAVTARHYGAVLFLLEQGIDTQLRDKSGQTAYELAQKSKLSNIAYSLQPDRLKNNPLIQVKQPYPRNIRR